MTVNKKRIIIMLLLLALTGVIAVWVFNALFAEIAIDYFSFFAGIFLMVEGAMKMLASKEGFFPNQFFRAFRVMLGTCVFTIHLLQFMRT